ncbi:MAG: glycoside hydrolase family 27 protein [Firmicutes bacterium]|nr:glycoside hydrolase family 27 protein [Bacillota bacterium]
MSAVPDLALTPPMGFNTWNHFGGNIHETLIEEIMDVLVESGLANLGYRYLNIDDGWMAPERDAQHRLVPDPKRFPRGIARLADQAHALGLKLGIYSCCGTKTCMGLPGSYGFETLDAETFAEWGIDFLKQDWCHVPFDDFPGKSHREVAEVLYGRISDAMEKTGRGMVLSMCNWGDGEPWLWARGIAHMWRTTPDIADSFRGENIPQGTWSVLRIFEHNRTLNAYAGPGGWNDPDMLEVGNGGLTPTQARSHFALWCLMAAPLLLGHDLRTMTDDTRNIIANRALIAIDQDPLGVQAAVDVQAGLYYLVKPLAGGATAIGVFNATLEPQEAVMDWERMAGRAVRWRTDVWSERTEAITGSSRVSVAPDETLVWRVW